MNRRVLISGCSGAGKSTLVREMRKRSHRVVDEPGRRVIAEERAGSGVALPWVDMAAFARRALDMSRSDLETVSDERGPIFFDRGLVDAAVGLQEATGTPYRETLGDDRHYASPVFLAPPWPEIFVQDTDRRHDLAAAIAEFERLTSAFSTLGYDVVLLPKTDVEERADFVLGAIAHLLGPS